jgi:inner membrane transporter RhtA
MTFNKKWAILTSLCAMASVQGGASIAKYLFHLLGPAGAVTLRVGIAGILLMCLIRPKVSKFGRKEWLYTLFYGLSIGGMNLTFYYGIQRIPLGIGVAVEFIGPLGVALLCSRKMLDLLWAFLAAAGILLIVPWKGGTCDATGIIFTAAAGVLWASYIIFAGKITKAMKSSEAVTCGMCIATLLVLPFGFASGDLFKLDGRLLLLGLGVAVFSSALPFTLDLWTMKKIPPKTFGILQSLQPAFGALSGLLFLGEILTLRQWTAILCVVAASTGAAIFSPERK